MTYHVTPEAIAKGMITLSGSKVTTVNDSEEFSIVNANDDIRSFHLKAPTTTAKTKWIEALN